MLRQYPQRRDRDRQTNLELRKVLNGLPLCAILTVFPSFLSISDTIRAQAIEAESRKWSLDLPSTSLASAHIRTEKLPQAWKDISERYLFPVILCVSENTNLNRPFQFEALTCKVADLFNAFVDTYPDFRWLQDAETGVVWFYPADMSYVSILSKELNIPFSQLGLRMQDDILKALSSIGGLGWGWHHFGGVGFTNMYNYEVDIPKGRYTIRHLLNICRASQLDVSFLIRISGPNAGFITPVSLSPIERKMPMRDGAIEWWKHHLSAVSAAGISKDMVVEQLSNPNRRIRRAAVPFVSACSRLLASPKKLLQHQEDPEKNLWMCLELTSIYVRTEGVTLSSAKNRMLEAANEGILKTCPPDLAVLVALDLARLTKETKYLDQVKARSLKNGDLQGCMSDVCRMARFSPTICEYLQTTGCGWLKLSAEHEHMLEQILVDTKLQFSVVPESDDEE